VEDSLGTTEPNMFVKALTITNGTNQTMFNNSVGFNRNYSDKSGGLIPYDFINQVIPVIFQALLLGEKCWMHINHATSSLMSNIYYHPLQVFRASDCTSTSNSAFGEIYILPSCLLFKYLNPSINKEQT
jgi:hypothetical protein